MIIYALICHKLDLTQFWPEVVSWRFEITTDEVQDIWLYLSFINIKELDFWPLMSSSKKLANYLIKALRGDLA